MPVTPPVMAMVLPGRSCKGIIAGKLDDHGQKERLNLQLEVYSLDEDGLLMRTSQLFSTGAYESRVAGY